MLDSKDPVNNSLKLPAATASRVLPLQESTTDHAFLKMWFFVGDLYDQECMEKAYLTHSFMSCI